MEEAFDRPGRMAASRASIATQARDDQLPDDFFGLRSAAGRARPRRRCLWYLSGLTCTSANVTEKGEFRAAAAAHGVIIVAPDTSPRGADVPDDPDDWQFWAGRRLLPRRETQRHL